MDFYSSCNIQCIFCLIRCFYLLLFSNNMHIITKLGLSLFQRMSLNIKMLKMSTLKKSTDNFAINQWLFSDLPLHTKWLKNNFYQPLCYLKNYQNITQAPCMYVAACMYVMLHLHKMLLTWRIAWIFITNLCFSINKHLISSLLTPTVSLL